MKLLSEKELIWSTVVANSTMNRARNASGLNSYEKEFRSKPEQFLYKHIEQFGPNYTGQEAVDAYYSFTN